MSMKIKPLNEDLLLCIFEILSLYRRNIPIRKGAYSNSPLESLLWGTASFFEVPDVDVNSRSSAPNGQLANLLEIFVGNASLGTLPCKLLFTERNRKSIHESLLQDLSFANKMSRKDARTRGIANVERKQELLKRFGESEEISATYLDLYTLRLSIWRAREAEWRRIQSLPTSAGKEYPEAEFLILKLPVDLMLTKNKEALMPFLDSVFNKYLDDFYDRKIEWSENVLLWEHQEKLIWKVLEDMFSRFGNHFKLSYRELLALNAIRNDCKALETLFTLRKRKAIADIILNSSYPEGEIELIIDMGVDKHRNEKNEVLQDKAKQASASRTFISKKIYERLRPETLVLIKTFLLAEGSDYFWDARKCMLDRYGDNISELDDYDLYPSNLRDLIDDLLRDQWFAFDIEGARKSNKNAIPIIFELLNFCLNQKISLTLTFRDSKVLKDKINVIEKLLEQDKNIERKERNRVKIDELLQSAGRKTLVSLESVAELVNTISALYNGKDESGFWIKRLFAIELIHQPKEFFDGLKKVLHDYLESIMQADIPFEGVLPWSEQLEIVRSQLRFASGDKNVFSVDHRDFTRKISSYDTGIPTNIRPVECLFILEENEEIIIKSIQKDEVDNDDFIQFDLAYKIRKASQKSLPEPSETKALANEEQAVIFDEKNGNVIVGKKMIGEIVCASRQYYFFLKLFQNIGNPVPHEELVDYVKEKMGIKTIEVPGAFLSKIKGDLPVEIKQLIKSKKNSYGDAGYSLRATVKISDN